MDQKDEAEKAMEKERTVSSQVLEYYQRFSQSRQLPKYLCGSDTHLKSPSDPEERALSTTPFGIRQNIEQTSSHVRDVSCIIS